MGEVKSTPLRPSDLPRPSAPFSVPFRQVGFGRCFNVLEWVVSDHFHSGVVTQFCWWRPQGLGKIAVLGIRKFQNHRPGALCTQSLAHSWSGRGPLCLRPCSFWSVLACPRAHSPMCCPSSPRRPHLSSPIMKVRFPPPFERCVSEDLPFFVSASY